MPHFPHENIVGVGLQFEKQISDRYLFLSWPCATDIIGLVDASPPSTPHTLTPEPIFRMSMSRHQDELVRWASLHEVTVALRDRSSFDPDCFFQY